jgi:ABC-type sugar transport system ATPase subunit
MIYVTHDQVEAMTLADRIVVLNEGRVEQIGTPMELYHSPRTRFVAGFIGSPSMNFVEAEARQGDDHQAKIFYGTHEVEISGIDLAAIAAGPVTLGIRPEHVQVVEAGGPNLQAEVRVVEALGNESYVYVHTEQGDEMVIKADGDIDVRRGQAVGLSYAPHRCQLFQSDGLTLPRLDRATAASEPIRE